VSERLLRDDDTRSALRIAAESALRGDRVLFPLLRTVEDFAAARVAGVAACGGRVTLNLPRAARRAGRGNVEGFLRDCERLVELAVEALRARREHLALVCSAPQGSLAPLFRGPRGRAALYDLATTTWSVGITGLNEALVHLTGFELHEGDDAVRTAKRIASCLSLRVKAAGLAVDLPTSLDADEETGPARRFLHLDRRQDPERTAATFAQMETYTPGVAVRTAAPVDLFSRVEREQALHAWLASATVRLPLPRRDCGGPDGVLALLSKCLIAGTALGVEIVPWS
jgi:hypothetical protein